MDSANHPSVGRMLVTLKACSGSVARRRPLVRTVGHAVDGMLFTQRSACRGWRAARGDDLHQLMIGWPRCSSAEMQIVQILHLGSDFTQPRIGGAEMGDEGFEIRTNIGTRLMRYEFVVDVDHRDVRNDAGLP